MKEKTVVVVGASNLDIKGRSESAVYSRMKNPGTIEITPGGVGRNIAENLSRLGVSTVLLSAISRNNLSSIILEETEKSGVDTSRILFCDDKLSGIFMAIINSRGDLESSISDMSILSRITPDYVLSHQEVFDKASFVVLDADIPRETLALCIKLSRERQIPVCVEPVSPAKAKVMTEYLKDINLTTPNREELEVLVGRATASGKDIQEAGQELVTRGVEYVVVTLGPEGVYCASKDFCGFIPSISTLVVDSVGAGDALVSGVVTGFLQERDFLNAVKCGVAAATMTLTTNQAVNPAISVEAVNEFTGKIKVGTPLV